MENRWTATAGNDGWQVFNIEGESKEEGFEVLGITAAIDTGVPRQAFLWGRTVWKTPGVSAALAHCGSAYALHGAGFWRGSAQASWQLLRLHWCRAVSPANPAPAQHAHLPMPPLARPVRAQFEGYWQPTDPSAINDASLTEYHTLFRFNVINNVLSLPVITSKAFPNPDRQYVGFKEVVVKNLGRVWWTLYNSGDVWEFNAALQSPE